MKKHVTNALACSSIYLEQNSYFSDIADNSIGTLPTIKLALPQISSLDNQNINLVLQE